MEWKSHQQRSCAISLIQPHEHRHISPQRSGDYLTVPDYAVEILISLQRAEMHVAFNAYILLREERRMKVHNTRYCAHIVVALNK